MGDLEASGPETVAGLDHQEGRPSPCRVTASTNVTPEANELGIKEIDMVSFSASYKDGCSRFTYALPCEHI